MAEHTHGLRDREEKEDERPVSVHRKRRAIRSPSPAKDAASSSTSTTTTINKPSPTVLQTPTKPKKRVRFSDPGSDVSNDAASTGITPFISRTTLDPLPRSQSPSSSRPLAKPPRRRQSLPSLRVVHSSAALPSPALSGEFQFAPLRQLLDPRAKRRLRRNHLSEEINQIEAERRADVKKEDEIRALKADLAVVRQAGGEAVRDVGEEMGDRTRIEELEAEIRKVKEEARERSMTVEPLSSTTSSQQDTVETTSTVVYVDVDCGDGDDLQMVDYPDHSLSENQNFRAEATTQTTLTASEMTLLQEHIRSQTDHLVQARLELEYICPGETTLGLVTEQGNVKPILDAFIDRLRALKTQQHVSVGALNTLRMQETNLRNQFNIALQQLQSARETRQDLAAQMQASSSRAESEKKGLEADVDEKQRSIGKLTQALDGYRSEVKDLEALIMGLEAQHKTALADLRSEMDEAVADLECHVVAETRGRRDAEEESEQRMLRIRELETKEKELQDARNEKQDIIRNLEKELENEKKERECEVGGLNVRVGQLSSSLSEARADVAKLEIETTRLTGLLEAEKTSTANLVQRVKDETNRHIDQIWANYQKDAQGRGREVAEHKGLLTPVDAVRFKDTCTESCEGRVEMRRGKTRSKRGVDSGIGILEEDEDED
ncbi:hypothetical protein MMC30_002398 [Trapelia coarctata]|nr:hypothetical protein [Trapelia coarctata]